MYKDTAGPGLVEAGRYRQCPPLCGPGNTLSLCQARFELLRKLRVAQQSL